MQDTNEREDGTAMKIRRTSELKLRSIHVHQHHVVHVGSVLQYPSRRAAKLKPRIIPTKLAEPMQFGFVRLRVSLV